MNFIKNNYRKIITILFVVSVLGYGIKTIYAQRQSGTDTTRFDVKKDLVVTPKTQDIKEEVKLAGSIDAASKADLRFQTSGQLAWVGVKVGDRVKKWQSIASLNRDELKKKLEMDLNNYKASLSTFQDTQDKYQDTKDKSLITDEIQRILDRSQYGLNNSVINYELTNMTMRYATLVSPIAGIVTKVEQPSSGINVTPATATFSVIDPQSIYFKSEIDQDSVTKIKVGQKTNIKLDSYPDTNFESKITYISFTPIAGQSSTVYEVRFELPKDNDDLKYRIGMNGDAGITVNEAANILTLPVEAIQDNGSEKFVYVKGNNNEISKKTIKTGVESDTDVQILEGISENEQIVIKQK